MSLDAPGADCFVRGTLVLAPGEARPIDDLQPGDEVFSFALGTGTVVRRRVLRVRRSIGIVLARMELGDVVIEGVTPDHPFFHATEREWIPADRLDDGDPVLSWRLGAVEPVEVTTVRLVPQDRPVAVFNLTLEGGEQCYFAEGLLVGG